MSFVIQGMDIPKTASLWLMIKPDGKVYKIKNGGEYGEQKIGTAVPIPEKHGDLIDRDALLNEGADISDGYDVGGFCEATEWGYSTKMIESAPAIVPAEGGGEE